MRQQQKQQKDPRSAPGPGTRCVPASSSAGEVRTVNSYMYKHEDQAERGFAGSVTRPIVTARAGAMAGPGNAPPWGRGAPRRRRRRRWRRRVGRTRAQRSCSAPSSSEKTRQPKKTSSIESKGKDAGKTPPSAPRRTAPRTSATPRRRTRLVLEEVTETPPPDKANGVELKVAWTHSTSSSRR